MSVRQWEHTTISLLTNQGNTFRKELTRLGAEGWECAGVACIDATIGANSIVAVLKREIFDQQPGPADAAEGWHPDPFARGDRRYWNGRVWTAHVAHDADKKQVLLAPTAVPTENVLA